MAISLSIAIQLSGQNDQYPFQNPNLSNEQRVDDLLQRLTLTEKVSQMQDISPAIERLGIEEYNWWNECLHGVARAGRATSFPQAIGMAATWNTDLIHEVAGVISDEARAKFNYNIQKGQRNRYQGLTMWTPNINIFRDPRWGRGQETYGEDPYLTTQLGVAFVKGLQGDDSDYYKVIATPKHFAVHSGPEYNRHSFDAYTNKKDLWETYLPAFEATVKEGKAHSVMSAYNRYLGESATASQLLLTDILRNQWGFEGYVVSDCGAVSDIYKHHKIAETAEEAATLAVKNGCDLNCGNTYNALTKAVEQGLLTEKEIDTALGRLLLARMKLGLFNPIDQMPYAHIDETHLESEEHQQLALQTAKESMVLLKNDKQLLPFNDEPKSIVLIGPNANDNQFLLGNYFGVPSNRTTILEGMQNKIPKGSNLHYFKGVNIADDQEIFDIIPTQQFTGGIKAEYYDNATLDGAPIQTDQIENIDFEWGGAAPIPGLKPGNFSIRFTGTINPDENGEYALAVDEVGGHYQLYINDELFAQTKNGDSPTVQFKKDKSYTFRLDYHCTNEWISSIQLRWNWEAVKGKDYMMDKVKQSDVIVFVGGISTRLEGEEMPIDVDGFYKGDRTNLLLPKAQQDLLKELKATGKPVIFLLTAGSAMSINWEQENLDAILNIWYPGQAGGDAVADILFGHYNPSGCLPLTYYKSVDNLPDFEDYSMKERTYRYFTKDVLYPFGYGLSYSSFNIQKPILAKKRMGTDDSNTVTAEVTNTGNYDGDVVIQLYIKTKNLQNNAPLKSLKGFQKIHLKQGESKTVTFSLGKDELHLINENGEQVFFPGNYEVLIGLDSNTTNSVQLSIQ
ncbi:glycoside hydrolase family 3 C-terminal domain-containing protein [Carboxylicivirga sp. M1479]|uniref:glycoside hydrolase family 3 C-terminal domain-containing protein n=1 Tax=Carboxylicivirga sp. M1479 TaxID=2594476 RepID=UPI00163D760C|nr:glycoside hydrolase family 3 C-terminal domain-containing protein [Carboxylicivirga sp. M1479]